MVLTVAPLTVAPLRHVAAVLAHRKPSHVLTLLAPEGPDPVCSDARHLILRFNDVTVAANGVVAPTVETVRRILAFGAEWKSGGSGAPLLIHCYAGISRSTAAAYILACAFAGAGQEEALAARLRAASPSATPNSLMVALADDVLDRGGRMSGAIAAIGRGIFAAEGVPFDLVFD